MILVSGNTKDCKELRLIFCQCPNHGVDLDAFCEMDEDVWVVKCPVDGCDIEGYSEGKGNPVTLNPFQYNEVINKETEE